MKRATALRYAREIARRLHEVNGLLATPVCKHEAVRVRRELEPVWAADTQRRIQAMGLWPTGVPNQDSQKGETA